MCGADDGGELVSGLRGLWEKGLKRKNGRKLAGRRRGYHDWSMHQTYPSWHRREVHEGRTDQGGAGEVMGDLAR